jgi:hypothetical protein
MSAGVLRPRFLRGFTAVESGRALGSTPGMQDPSLEQVERSSG